MKVFKRENKAQEGKYWRQ